MRLKERTSCPISSRLLLGTRASRSPVSIRLTTRTSCSSLRKTILFISKSMTAATKSTDPADQSRLRRRHAANCVRTTTNVTDYPQGQSYYEASRKLVLRGADGVVFVADSSPEFMHANKVSWADMNNHLASHGIALEKLPVVLQCNKQDLVYAVDPQTMKNLLNLYDVQAVPAIAVRGEGVLETLKLITRGVLAYMQQQQQQRQQQQQVAA